MNSEHAVFAIKQKKLGEEVEGEVKKSRKEMVLPAGGEN